MEFFRKKILKSTSKIVSVQESAASGASPAPAQKDSAGAAWREAGMHSARRTDMEFATRSSGDKLTILLLAILGLAVLGAVVLASVWLLSA